MQPPSFRAITIDLIVRMAMPMLPANAVFYNTSCLNFYPPYRDSAYIQPSPAQIVRRNQKVK